MKRRQLIAAFAGAVAAWPREARPQQAERIRRISVLIGARQSDPEVENYLTAFQDGLRVSGWMVGRNIGIHVRTAADPESMRTAAAELIKTAPELLVTLSTPATSAARQVSSAVPIVFVAVSDPIGTGFAESFAHPGGNITGFTNFEAAMGGKWVELLHEIAPAVSRVSMLFNPGTANTGARGGVYLGAIESAARILGLELIIAALTEPADIDKAFAAMAQNSRGGAIVMPNVFTIAHRERIVAQASRFGIPTIYPHIQSVKAGGLLYYGVSITDLFRRAASYADRILKGAKPAELPVQQPTKFELVVNVKSAKALGLAIPSTLLVSADELIE
jgi:putative ABC transport system substrate-binding protein